MVEKPKVKVADVKARPVDQIQEYTATVEAEAKNNIAPSSPVRIDQIFVEVGDRVSKGQKLVQMDAANLKQTKLQLDNQEIEFNRMDELYKVGGASKSEWDASKMQLDVQRTAYKNLLENTSLVSPINGVVTARNYDNGDMYSGGNPVLVVNLPASGPCISRPYARKPVLYVLPRGPSKTAAIRYAGKWPKRFRYRRSG